MDKTIIHRGSTFNDIAKNMNLHKNGQFSCIKYNNVHVLFVAIVGIYK